MAHVLVVVVWNAVAVHPSAVSVGFALFPATWWLVVTAVTGEFYSAEVTRFRQFVWIADAGNCRVQAVSREGRPLSSIGQPGDAPGDLALPKGVELALKKEDNPVVATVVVPQLITEEEEAAAAAAAVAPSEVPTTEQAAEPKEGEAAAAAGDKGADKGAAKAEKPAAADKGEKKEKK